MNTIHQHLTARFYCERADLSLEGAYQVASDFIEMFGMNGSDPAFPETSATVARPSNAPPARGGGGNRGGGKDTAPAPEKVNPDKLPPAVFEDAPKRYSGGKGFCNAEAGGCGNWFDDNSTIAWWKPAQGEKFPFRLHWECYNEAKGI